jgi:predicted small metal-binding protein
MTTPAFAARDNVPDCAWQVEGDELDSLFEAAQDHLIDEHLIGSRGLGVTYTHISCGEQRASIADMRWHLYMHMVMPAAVGS